MALKITIQIPIRSKPRGGLGKFRNMTHALNGYHEYQEKFRFKLKAAYGEKPLPEFWCMVYIFHSPTNKLGRKQDLDNMIGMVNDVLTPSEDKHGNMSFEWLKDDSWGYLPRIWGDVRYSNISKVELYFCKSPLDFLGLFVKLYLSQNKERLVKAINIIRKQLKDKYNL